MYFSRLSREGPQWRRVGSSRRCRRTRSARRSRGRARRLGAAWQDRRDATGATRRTSNRLTLDGEKLRPDQRVSFARGYSVNASITWTGAAFVLAVAGRARPARQRALQNSTRSGSTPRAGCSADQRLTRDAGTSENPGRARPRRARVGLAWMRRGGDGRAVWFMTADDALHRVGAEAQLSRPASRAVNAALTWAATAGSSPGTTTTRRRPTTVWGAAVDREGARSSPRGGSRATRASRATRPPAARRPLPHGVERRPQRAGATALRAQVFSLALDPLTEASAVTRRRRPP